MWKESVSFMKQTPYFFKMNNFFTKVYTDIAARYELMNHILTFGLDVLWRRKTVGLADQANPGQWMDLCTGTGEMAVLLDQISGQSTSIYGVDFTSAMLARAKDKANNINYIKADVVALPFADNHFDLITISLASRNLDSAGKLDKFFQEVYRLLKKDGLFIHLETTIPDSKIMQILMKLYMRLVVDNLGRLLSSSKNGYSYLANSITAFYPPDVLKGKIIEAGFEKVTFKKFFPGIVAVHIARKE